jgi:long-chain fatty acid transport protein
LTGPRPRRSSTPILWPVLAAAVLLCTQARAGGAYLPDPGVIAQGRGCAYTATADELIGAYFNPAGLHAIDGFYVHLAGGYVRQDIRFDRVNGEGRYKPFRDGEDPSDPAGIEAMLDRPFDTVRNEEWQIIPELGLAYGFADPDLTIGFAFYTPYSPKTGYDPTGPARYTRISASSVQAHFSLFASMRVAPFLALGLSGGLMLISAEERMMATANALAAEGIEVTPNDENPLYDLEIVTTAQAQKPWIVAGVLVMPTEWLRIGAAFTPGFQVDGDAHISLASEIEVVTGYPLVIDTGDDVQLTARVPPILRLGVAVQPTPLLELELDLVVEAWSTISGTTLNDVNVDLSGIRHQLEAMAPGYTDDVAEMMADMGDEWAGPNGDGVVEIPREYGDAWSLRFGAEAEATPWLRVRGGALYEESGVFDEYISPALPEPDRFGLSLGASAGPPGIEIHVSWLHYFYRPVDVTDGTAWQITALPTLAPNNTNDGQYRSHTDIVGLAVSIRTQEIAEEVQRRKRARRRR